MSISKISYTDKTAGDFYTAANANQVKESVNDNADQFVDVSNARRVATVADLKAFTFETIQTDKANFPIQLLGYNEPGDGGGGLFYVDTADTTTAEIPGIIVVTTGGLRIKRLVEGAVNPRWCGAKGDKATDDTTPIQTAVNYAESIGLDIQLTGIHYWDGNNPIEIGNGLFPCTINGKNGNFGFISNLSENENHGVIRINQTSKLDGVYFEKLVEPVLVNTREGVIIKDVTIENCVFKNCEVRDSNGNRALIGLSIGVSTQRPFPIHGLYIYRNKFYNNIGDHISFQTMDLTDVIIKFNYFKGARVPNLAIYPQGLGLISFVREPEEGKFKGRFIISENIFVDSECLKPTGNSAPIILRGESAIIHDNIIDGFIDSGNDGYAILVRTNNFSIIGNKISNIEVGADDGIIDIKGNGDYGIIAYNHIENCGLADTIQAGAENLYMVGNTVLNCTGVLSFRLRKSGGYVISGNKFIRSGYVRVGNDKGNVTIENNRFEDTLIYLDNPHTPGTSNDDITIIKDNEFASVSELCGIFSLMATFDRRLGELNIYGNTFNLPKNATGRTGIGINRWLGNVFIENNIFILSAVNPLSVLAAISSKMTICNSNKFILNEGGDTGNEYMIRILGDEINFKNNTVKIEEPETGLTRNVSKIGNFIAEETGLIQDNYIDFRNTSLQYVFKTRSEFAPKTLAVCGNKVVGTSSGFYRLRQGSPFHVIVKDNDLTEHIGGIQNYRPDAINKDVKFTIVGNLVNEESLKNSNSGEATITSANTSISVDHGLIATPKAQNIKITALNSMGDSIKAWISNITSTSFDINVNVAPNTESAQFSWSAEITEFIIEEIV